MVVSSDVSDIEADYLRYHDAASRGGRDWINAHRELPGRGFSEIVNWTVVLTDNGHAVLAVRDADAEAAIADPLQASIDAKVAVLQSVEWVSGTCPVCGAAQGGGVHNGGCDLAAELV